MDLVTGGSFQGKIAYAKRAFKLNNSDICDCSENEAPDLSKRCLYHFEKYLLYCIRNGIEPQLAYGGNKVIILTNIFQGVFPKEAEARLWKEECERASKVLSESANSVVKVVCGLRFKVK